MSRKDISENSMPKDSHKWFFFTMLYLIIDYGRPQDILPIAWLRIGMISNIILAYFIISNGGYKKYSSRQIKLVICFIALLAIHVPFSTNNYWAWIALKTMLLYFPFMVSVVYCVDSIERLKKTIMVFIILMSYVAIYSILHKGKGSGNYFQDENDLSLYINTYLPFCYFLFFKEKNIKNKLIMMSCLTIGLISIVVSFSRGGFVGLIAIGIVVWLASAKKVRSLAIIAIIAGLFYIFIGHAYIKEMDTITDPNDVTANVRLESWAAAWRMFLDNPMGVGGNNFMIRFPEYQSSWFHKGMWGREAHSLWFTLIPELGIPGIIVYFYLIYYNAKDLLILKRISLKIKDDQEYLRSLSSAMIAAFAGYFASGSFISVLYYAHYWYLVAILVATLNLAKKLESASSTGPMANL